MIIFITFIHLEVSEWMYYDDGMTYKRFSSYCGGNAMVSGDFTQKGPVIKDLCDSL